MALLQELVWPDERSILITYNVDEPLPSATPLPPLVICIGKMATEPDKEHQLILRLPQVSMEHLVIF